jgi:hypothetical protein
MPAIRNRAAHPDVQLMPGQAERLGGLQPVDRAAPSARSIIDRSMLSRSLADEWRAVSASSTGTGAAGVGGATDGISASFQSDTTAIRRCLTAHGSLHPD